MSTLLLIAIFTAILALGPTTPTGDDSSDFGVYSAPGAFDVHRWQHGANPPTRASVTRGTQPAVAEAPRAHVAVLGCIGNEPTLTVPHDAMCVQAADMCAGTANPNDLLYWLYEGPPGVANPTQGQWVRTGEACLTYQQARNQGQGALVMTAEDFRRLPLPAGVAHIQPGNGRTLINVPTNVYVDAKPAIIPTVLLGTPIRVRATPVGYDWTFGDGGALHTKDPGAAYPDLRTTHTYSQPGTMKLTLATTYSGEYALPGGPWIPIDGTATVASPAQNLVVVAARAELVDQPLPSE